MILLLNKTIRSIMIVMRIMLVMIIFLLFAYTIFTTRRTVEGPWVWTHSYEYEK